MLEKEPLDLDKKVVGERERSFLASAGLFFLELIKIVILAGVTIGLVRYFLFKPFYVRGQSMEPNFYEKDYLIIDELSYRLREPERGEVVVFKAPNGGKDYYLKRIVGLPGERVKISDDKIIIYNDEFPQGTVLPETYLEKTTYGNVDQTLGTDEYFVLGDNRGASYDSRRFGPISKDEIVGRAWLRGWPFTRAAAFSAPRYEL
ncbi:MAG: signal peptidase I [Candidatus Magasanikbacteria bacterium RIFCSPLOWO2_01_FULL_43_20b]|uniref:Signal peptidase I n=1 Tax=Candidatus Magasanikbacteria bacterium RIFCSPLOWO2_12_FULL_43_12 TaxID=1798692 RepID=A0A1F6MW29_9BACT|nr:MAG: signal peptidase I [Candidatus Magasanikbacteria bacterium RIFCSPHIGHO2_02_FULL_44_13]OGH71678.1 MAG: signal peptidase I [Candidatus Magasanikbacteria bacterium RIFCSPLOWO2_02_FULL_43_22]OGH73197.1 MAG: signal peptidase I [Candidatus Magasanikbacteria bacterium RIFCSPLOWO2_01_FULL_43_20b]OGH75700.1 MAG: signal peptidase I [Candidatus Magasanikbacteria bacterium RIFCSPLOWO2_12_FULL_43_12]